jgi:hypothetical protein
MNRRIRKTLWMTGLSIALLVFGGLFVLCCIDLVQYRRLNLRGYVFLISSGYITWMVLHQMFTGARELVADDEDRQPPA